MCNITPAASAQEETLNTLKFAQRAKNIEVTMERSVLIDEKSLIKSYQKQIVELKRQLAESTAARPPREHRRRKGVNRNSLGLQMTPQTTDNEQSEEEVEEDLFADANDDFLMGTGGGGGGTGGSGGNGMKAEIATTSADATAAAGARPAVLDTPWSPTQSALPPTSPQSHALFGAGANAGAGGAGARGPGGKLGGKGANPFVGTEALEWEQERDALEGRIARLQKIILNSSRLEHNAVAPSASGGGSSSGWSVGEEFAGDGTDMGRGGTAGSQSAATHGNESRSPLTDDELSALAIGGDRLKASKDFEGGGSGGGGGGGGGGGIAGGGGGGVGGGAGCGKPPLSSRGGETVAAADVAESPARQRRTSGAGLRGPDQDATTLIIFDLGSPSGCSSGTGTPAPHGGDFRDDDRDLPPSPSNLQTDAAEAAGLGPQAAGTPATGASAGVAAMRKSDGKRGVFSKLPFGQVLKKALGVGRFAAAAKAGKLDGELSQLERELHDRVLELTLMRADNAVLKDTNGKLQLRVESLQRQLGSLPSSN